MELNPRTSSKPFTTLQVSLSYEEFAILRDIYDEMWAFVGRIDPNALASLGGHNEMARTLLTTALEAWKEERDEALVELERSEEDTVLNKFSGAA